MNITVSGSTLLAAIFGLIVFVVGLIVVLRFLFAKRSSQSNLLQDDSPDFLFIGRNKLPEVDVFHLSGTFFNVALALALSLVILAFSWTKHESKIETLSGPLPIDEWVEVIPPTASPPPPKPPLPPPPPVIEEVPDDDIEIDTLVFKDQLINEKTDVETPIIAVKKKSAPVVQPPLPEPKKIVQDEIFKVVEEMPRFPGCEQLGSNAEKKQCADKKLLDFIYKNIKYPAIARENGVEGTCVIQFVVEKTGKISGAKLVRDIGGGCGTESLRVVKLMDSKNLVWEPGRQRGEAVRVQFNLPVKFRLE